MRILGIETSCDETGLALIEIKKKDKFLNLKIIKNLVASQIKIHQKFGGIMPSLAQREHQKNLPFLFKKLGREKFNLIGVTIGPGLDPCLWQGINFAQNLSQRLNLPLIGINHLKAHIFSVFLTPRVSLNFPFLALIISGGHTILVKGENLFSYKVLAETRDDAIGETFDKIGRMLGFPYPAGPLIELFAKKGRPTIDFPSPMLYQKNYDFSFSGLKTAFLYYLKEHYPSKKTKNIYLKEQFLIPEKDKACLCASFQKAAFRVLISKTFRAAQNFKISSIIVCGGVASNSSLKKEFKKEARKKKLKILFPKKIFACDNGAMVALTAYFYRNQPKLKLVSQPNLKF